MELIKKYFPNLTSVQIKRFENLAPLYSEWNSKINVISRKDVDKLYERHVLHSLAIAKVINFIPGTRILDVGTGGGFPGIPLAILFSESEFLLVDSIGKKIKVVNEIKTSLKLENVKSLKSRAEEIDGEFDFVVSRAVTSMPVFYKMVKKKVARENRNPLKNGILYLKGGDFYTEIAGFGKRVTIYPLSKYFNEPFFETKKLLHISV